MMADIIAFGPRSKRDFALKYAAIGWHVVPLWWWDEENDRCACGDPDCGTKNQNNPGKHPHRLARSGHLDATIDKAKIEYWWDIEPRCNIGVFLAKSGLCAIDIDPRNGGLETIEDIEAKHGPLQSDVLQFTGGGGEHRVFVRPEGALPGKLGPGIDVKLNGYIVVEPSNHRSGGRYEWEASSSPLDGVCPSSLPDWMRDLDGKVEMPKSAGVAGARTITEAQATELRDALRFIDADSRDAWVRVGMALRALGAVGFSLWDEYSSRSAKYTPHTMLHDWRSFHTLSIGYESIFHMAQQGGWPNPLSSQFAAPALPDPIPATSITLPPPAENAIQTPEFRLPGVLGAVQDWIDATARKPQPAFAIQAALAFGSAVLGRRYVTCQRNWPALYYMNIGKSASGKEHAKWAIEALLEGCQLPQLIGPAGYTSDSGVLSALHRQPSHLAVIDEFGKVLEGASVKHGARSASTLRMLMEVWARADGVMRPQGYSTFGMTPQDIQKLEQRTVRHPSLTLLTMTTPESFFDAVGSAAARDGFLNRFLIVESGRGSRHPADHPGLGAQRAPAGRARQRCAGSDPECHGGAVHCRGAALAPGLRGRVHRPHG